MRTWLLAFVCACTPAVPARPALVPPPTATPPPDPARILSPIGPPLTAATRLLDRPAAALALAWTHPLGEHQQPVIVDRRLVLLERWLSDDPEQRYAVLDAIPRRWLRALDEITRQLVEKQAEALIELSGNGPKAGIATG